MSFCIVCVYKITKTHACKSIIMISINECKVVFIILNAIINV